MKNGVNLIGYSRAESGLGEACRSAAKALQSVGIPFCIINFPICPFTQNDLSWVHKEVQQPKYPVNIFFINADQMQLHYHLNNLKREWFTNRYNIGYWHWELPEFPDKWVESSQLVNEIWVPSLFTLHSISPKVSKPIYSIPHAISVDVPSHLNRIHFSLPKNQYLFLTMYDVHSTLIRKNPIAVIRAFKKAFLTDDPSVGLVVKINHASDLPREVDILKQQARHSKNIYLIDKNLSREEMNGLMSVTNSFVSLHRSEGFGLSLAEAMYLGKPVMATNWSGNIDFMKENNSYLVDYALRRIGTNFGPYSAEQYWADPHIEQATSLMKQIVADKNKANRIGLLGKKTIETKFSAQVIGEMYKLRLKQLGLI